MKPQIVHEAEIHRQHVRLRIPIAVEIDGTRFGVDDWSMGGLGVAGPITLAPARRAVRRAADLPVRGFRADAAAGYADGLRPAGPAAVRHPLRRPLAGPAGAVPLHRRRLPVGRDRLGRRHPERGRQRPDRRSQGSEAVLRAERGRQLGPPDSALCRHRAHGAGRRRPYRPDRGRALSALLDGHDRPCGDRGADLPARGHRRRAWSRPAMAVSCAAATRPRG